MNAPREATNLLTHSLTPAAIEAAVKQARPTGASPLPALARATGLDERSLTFALAENFQYAYCETPDMLAWQADLETLPLAQALKRGIALFRDATLGPVAVIHDPFERDLMRWIEARTAGHVTFKLSSRSDIQAYLARAEQTARALHTLAPTAVRSSDQRSDVEHLSLTSISEGSSPTVQVVNSMIYDALKEGASDIHLRRVPAGLVVLYRIDGVLGHALNVDAISAAEEVISRIKVLAELDISERRVPQDGKLKVQAEQRLVDIRVSIMPTIHGEAAVLRILDKRSIVGADGLLHLADLGFDTDTLDTLKRLTALPYGMLLVTGPTGSGKTTTLYAALTEIDHSRENLLTIEDPVEYELDGVEQIPVNEKKGLTFAVGLRSILRHDPDRILVGEIRDRETAEMAIQAALTGHAVYSTLHANNSFEVFNRFAYMNVDPYALTSALNGIWAQRLVRTLCSRCAEQYDPPQAALQQAGLSTENMGGWSFRNGIGCGDCRGTGYRGRRAIAEVMPMTDPLRALIADHRPVHEIRAHATAQGTRLLRAAALELVKAGITSLDEANRVTLAA